MLHTGRSPVRIPDEDFFNLPHSSSRTMALWSTQPLTEMSPRNLPGGKSGRRVGLTTLPPSISRMSENVVASTSRNPKGLRGLYRDSFKIKMRSCIFHLNFNRYRVETHTGKNIGFISSIQIQLHLTLYHPQP
jgi:hypothetical protein